MTSIQKQKQMIHLATIFRMIWMRYKYKILQHAKAVAISRFEGKYRGRIESKLHQLLSHRLAYRSYYWWSKYIKFGWLKAKLRANLDNYIVLNIVICYNKIITPRTYPNYVACLILGFVAGVILTYLYFIILAIALGISTVNTFYISVLLCIFLTIGMAFFEQVRCIVFSILPQMFTEKARAMFISYALLLLMTGPTVNIFYNSQQLTDTLVCTRTQFNEVGHNITELYLKPLRSLGHGMTTLMKKLKPAISSIKDALIFIKDSIVSLTQTISKMVGWFFSTISICNKTIGTPRERCVRFIEKASKECTVRLFDFLKFICDIGNIVQNVCYILKPIDYLCDFISFVKSDLFPFVKTKIKEFVRFIKTMFYVSVSFRHSFGFKTNQSKSLKDVFKETFAAQKERLRHALGILDLMKFVLSCYIIYVLLTTFIYRYRFFHHPHFDNYHVNRYLIELDIRRAAAGRQTILPLTYIEKMNFVGLLSLRFTTHERKRFLRNSHFIFFTGIKVVYLLIIDVLLFWILEVVHKYGAFYFYFGNDKSLITEGSGFLWTVHNLINKILIPYDLEFRFDTRPCLPDPIHVDYLIYERVGIILCSAWLMVLFQPFGLRFRSFIMSSYYPETGKRRAVWLFNHIFQLRFNLTLYVRRQIGKAAPGLRSEQPSLRKWLIARFRLLTYCLPYRDMLHECMVCGYHDPKAKCATPDCPGTYCPECLETLNNTCLVCDMPQHLLGMDVSEEEDSEEDEIVEKPRRRLDWKLKKKLLFSHAGTENIAMENMEKGIPTKAVSSDEESDNEKSTSKTIQPDQPKDYFGDAWRKTCWASMDDFEEPMPDLKSWSRY